MGKPKTQRTERLIQAARRYVIAEEVRNHIEQHNFDSLVREGMIVRNTLTCVLAKNRLLFPEAGGRGRRGCDGLSVPPHPRRPSI